MNLSLSLITFTYRAHSHARTHTRTHLSLTTYSDADAMKWLPTEALNVLFRPSTIVSQALPIEVGYVHTHSPTHTHSVRTHSLPPSPSPTTSITHSPTYSLTHQLHTSRIGLQSGFLHTSTSSWLPSTPGVTAGTHSHPGRVG